MAGSPPFLTMVGKPRPDYALLDSGGGRKLESYGDVRIIRPEPQAMWQAAGTDWRADAEFVPGADEEGGGRWVYHRELNEDGWHAAWDDVRFIQKPTPFRHLAYFPDMDPVWRWMRDRFASRSEADTPKFLNLFGYTGVGTLAMASKGAECVHVDASKKSVKQARDNASLSGLDNAPIRWLIDDAVKFTAREVRRGRRYDGILLDPPKYGRGPKGETWRLEEALPDLMEDVAKLVDEHSSYVFLTVYAVRMSALSVGELMRQAFAHLPGTVECGEIAVEEKARGLLLPTALFARWSNPG